MQKAPSSLISMQPVKISAPDSNDLDSVSSYISNLGTKVLRSASKPRISSDEIKRELRHKYLVILKSCYWQFFEEG